MEPIYGAGFRSVYHGYYDISLMRHSISLQHYSCYCGTYGANNYLYDWALKFSTPVFSIFSRSYCQVIWSAIVAIMSSVCLSVSLSVCPSVVLSVSKYIAAKWYILQQKCGVPELVNRKCFVGKRFYNFQPSRPTSTLFAKSLHPQNSEISLTYCILLSWSATILLRI